MNFLLSRKQNKNKLKKFHKIVGSFSLRLLVFVLIFSWIFSGWPPIHFNDTLQFPPLPKEAYAAVAVDDVSEATGCDCSSFTITHTISSSSDNALVVVVHNPVGDDTKDVASVIWDVATANEPLSFYGAEERAGAKVRTEVWVATGLSTGTDLLITVTMDSQTKITGAAMSFTGVHQTTPLSDSAGTSGAKSQSENVDITNCTTGDIAMSGVTWKASDITAGQTMRWEDNESGGSGQSGYMGGGNTAAGEADGTVNLSWTSDTNDEWALFGFCVNQAPTGITVSGACYTDEGEGTACTDDGGNEIKVAVNGVPDAGVDAVVDDGWTFDISPLSSGDILTFFIDGETTETEEATTVIKYDGDGGDVTNVKLYQSQLVIGADSGSANSDQTISVADMNTTTGNGYEWSDNENVLYDVTVVDDLTVDADASKTEQLYIISGDTFRPASGGGSDTTTENLEIDASAVITADTNAFTITGNWNNNGTFTANSSTITFTAADVDNTIDGGSGATYNNLTFIGSDGSGTWTMQNDDFTVSGTIDVDTSDILTIDTGRILTHTGATMTLDGDIVGAGRLRFTDASGGPGAGAGTLSAITRFDASAGNIASTTFDARTYSGLVEIFSDDSAAAGREVAMANASYTLSGATSHLYVINNSNSWDLTLNGASNNPTVTIGGDLDYTGSGSNSEIITSGNAVWTVTGHVTFTDGSVTFTSGNTFQMNGASKNLTSNGYSFQNLTITGGTTVSTDQLTVAGNFQINNGATFNQAGASDLIVTGDAITIQDGGNFNKAGGGGIFIMDGISDNQFFSDGNTDTKENMGDVQIGQSPGTTKLSSNFAADSLTILTSDKFETHGWDVDIAGAIDCQGTCTFDLTDDDAGDGTIVTFGGNWTMSATGNFTPSTDSQVQPDGTADQAVTTGSKAFWDFYSNNAGASDDVDDVIISGAFTIDGALTVNDGELDLNANNPTTNIEGIVTINAGGELNAPGSLSAAGSWNNNGTFTANSGTVTFDSADTGETIDAGAQSFNNVIFNNANGGWTIQNDDMTVGVDLNLSAGNTFIVSSSIILEVQGAYSQVIAGGSTTWTGSTLYLNGSGGMYEINTKAHGGDVYATLRVGANEDIAMWDSYAETAYTIDSGACLYSQDHGTAYGQLNIYGTCTSRAAEYWSYAKDFNGDVVTRQADVRFADSATFTVDSGESLEIIGESANRTIITRQSAGNYGMTVDGTLNAQYYDFDYLNASGLNFTSNAVVTELSDGSFDNNATGTPSSYITVTNITSQKNFFNNTFDDNTDGTDADVDNNVNADGSGIDWVFFSWDGNKGGEYYDVDANGAYVGWNAELNMSVSDNIMNLGVLNTLLVGSDTHNITVTSNAVNGYTCRATEDGNLDDITDTYDINDVGDGTVDAGDEEYGISCSGVDCELTGDIALSGSPLVVAQSSAPADGTVTAVTYKAAVDSSTFGGNYSHVVTFTCTGDF